MPSITENICAIRERIREFERHYHREKDSVRLLAVSKRQNAQAIREACGGGQREFGENYLQEALEKINALEDVPATWHFIGPLQSNKTREVARHFQWVHSIDRLRVARRLNEQRPEDLPPLNVLIQVNHTGESSKSGVSMAEAEALGAEIASMQRLRLRGLMSMPAPEPRVDVQRAVYRALYDLYRRLGEIYPGFDTLSTGTSVDYEAAIAEGSTLVRLGTALFGERRVRPDRP